MRARRVLALALALALHGCGGPPRAPAAPRADPPASPASSAGAATRARAFLDDQLAGLLADTPGDHRRLLASFAPSASVLGEGPIERAIVNLRGGALAQDPHDEVLGARIASLAAGGDERAVWLQFELAVDVKAWESVGDEPGAPVHRTVRGAELLTAASGWKAVAAAFSTPGEPEPRQPAAAIPDPTEPGPLTPLAADPRRAARALRDDPAVAVAGFVPGELAVGPAAARALLARLAARNPVLRGAPRELRAPGWGFVHAQLDLPIAGETLPARAAVQVLALPDARGAWSVASVLFTAL